MSGTAQEFPYPETVLVIGQSYCIHCHGPFRELGGHKCNPSGRLVTFLNWKASWWT